MFEDFTWKKSAPELMVVELLIVFVGIVLL